MLLFLSFFGRIDVLVGGCGDGYLDALRCLVSCALAFPGQFWFSEGFGLLSCLTFASEALPDSHDRVPELQELQASGVVLSLCI